LNESYFSSHSLAPDGPKEIRAAAVDVGGTSHARFITIPGAKEEKSADGMDTFMMYAINIALEGKTTVVKKRFSEFVAFHKEWKGLYPNVDISMPKKLLSVDDEVRNRSTFLFICAKCVVVFPH